MAAYRSAESTLCIDLTSTSTRGKKSATVHCNPEKHHGLNTHGVSRDPQNILEGASRHAASVIFVFPLQIAAQPQYCTSQKHGLPIVVLLHGGDN